MLKETTFSKIISDYLEYSNSIHWNKEPQLLYEPFHFTMGHQGKKIRPLALLLSYSFFKKDISPALAAAYGIELFHNFTLLHDDIMDNAMTRRGKPTAHVQFGENRALLSGDAMLLESFNYIQQSSSINPQVIPFFIETGIRVCEGQSMDMAFENIELVSSDEYIQMIKLKTSDLLGAALKIGAMISTDDASIWEDLYQLGIALGIAFQIQDDYLDLYGDEQSFGKKNGGDLIQRKKSILILSALDKMPANERLDCIRYYNQERSDSDQINEFKILFEKYNIHETVKNLYNLYKDLCINIVNKMSLSEENQKQLSEFVYLVLERKY